MDRGTENVGIADTQVLLRLSHNDDLARSSVMFGSSNHNQRIERWWGYCRKAIVQCYMDLFKDLELSGVLRMDNVLHLECLKFCFMRVLRKELLTHAEIWNKHRVRNMKNIVSPTGIPNFLFEYPEYFDAEEQGQPADVNTVLLAKDVHFYEESEFGSDDVFNEWALSIMVQKEINLPNTFKDAFNLFSELILVISAMGY